MVRGNVPWAGCEEKNMKEQKTEKPRVVALLLLLLLLVVVVVIWASFANEKEWASRSVTALTAHYHFSWSLESSQSSI